MIGVSSPTVISTRRKGDRGILSYSGNEELALGGRVIGVSSPTVATRN